LVKNKLIKEDRTTLTELGRSSLRVVLAGGVFDIIHPGHIHTLNAAKALGDVLIVVVATDSTAVKMKKRQPLHSKEQRQELVNSLIMVDLCLIGQEDDIFKTVNLVKPQIIALGYDQVHQEKFIIDGCKKIELDATVARLQSPIPESSSSKIEKEYGESIHGI
ncbi:MAG: adenylyltransferase/cytidyltransferase family protein, partial [Thermoproteota archaeon]